MSTTIRDLQFSIEQSQKSCTRKLEGASGLVENNYRCDQTRFIAADLWNVHKQKHEIPRQASISVID
jgi:hypothetical protein